MQTHAEPRFKKRVPCRLSVGGALHSGMVLNVSRRGLFVQASVTARPGDDVELALSATPQSAGIPLRARVVWKRTVASHLRSVSRGGIGLRIEEAPELWFSFLEGITQPTEAPGASAETSQPGLAAESDRKRFRIRVQQTGGPRSRLVVVAAASEPDARRRALAQVGAGWTVLEAELLAAPRAGGGPA